MNANRYEIDIAMTGGELEGAELERLAAILTTDTVRCVAVTDMQNGAHNENPDAVSEADFWAAVEQVVTEREWIED